MSYSPIHDITFEVADTGDLVIRVNADGDTDVLEFSFTSDGLRVVGSNGNGMDTLFQTRDIIGPGGARCTCRVTHADDCQLRWHEG